MADERLTPSTGSSTRLYQTHRGQRLAGGNVEAVEKLHLQTCVLVRERLHPHPSFLLAPTETVPCDQALGARNFVSSRPKEGATKPVQRNQHASRKSKHTHDERGQRVEDGVPQDQPPTHRKQHRTQPRKILVGLEDEGLKAASLSFSTESGRAR
jgi:hypothetical protein